METATTKIREKTKAGLRHEKKIIINVADDMALVSRLSKLFPHDVHADSHGVYRVNSLYFDSPHDSALRQKMDGVNRREKFRFRYYGNDDTYINVEKKFKINGKCGKYSAVITKEQAQSILSGDISFLLESDNPLLLELYTKIRGRLLAPKTMVVYDREAFVYKPGNVRITIDRNLHSGLWNVDFLHVAGHTIPVSEGMSVLEIKYDNFLPEIVSVAVQIPNRQASSYSKYAVCRKYD